MNPDKAQEVTKKIARAKRTLGEVDILIDNNLWNIAVNRLYYACFYAVSALLHNIGKDTKTHSGAIQLLGLHFIKNGIISDEVGRTYTRLFDMRQIADYISEVEYEKEDVLELILPARVFISQVEEILLKE